MCISIQMNVEALSQVNTIQDDKEVTDNPKMRVC